MNHDTRCREIVDGCIHMTVPWYLMASYAYYQLSEAIISDGLYDHLAKLMLSRWDEIEHRHKHLITRDDLSAGTHLMSPGQDYPTIVKDAAERLIEDLHPQPTRRKRR